MQRKCRVEVTSVGLAHARPIIRTVTYVCLSETACTYVVYRSTAPLSPSQVSELIIPTVDTARQRFFLDTYIGREQDQVPLLFVGPTGTGKSAITNNYLVRLPKDKYVYVLVAIYYVHDIIMLCTCIRVYYVRVYVQA